MKTAPLLWEEGAVEELDDLAQPEQKLDNADHLAASSRAFPIRLSDRWQIVCDPRQYILQHQKGGRWRDRSFCVTRSALERVIREYVGHIDADARACVRALPPQHPDRRRTR
jgi:hypothetical protein